MTNFVLGKGHLYLKPLKEPAMKTYTFDVYRDVSGQWRWRLKAKNGKIVADGSEGYASRRNARRAALAFGKAVLVLPAEGH